VGSIDVIREQDHKLIKLFDKCHQFNNENANIKKQLEQNENCIELLRSENNSLRDENATYKAF
jgi:flagellar biosynthesis/type III secretory pathway chaperone